MIVRLILNKEKSMEPYYLPGILTFIALSNFLTLLALHKTLLEIRTELRVLNSKR